MLSLCGVTRRYPPPLPGGEAITALNGVDLSVKAGEFVAIIGHSGSGKSTLMHILGCLDRPDGGSYTLCGEDVLSCTAAQRARLRNRKIGFVFQNFQLIGGCTALENVELPLLFRGVPARQRRTLAVGALEAVGLAQRLQHRPGELSGGQQQRVAIARAIAASPALLLADEPTGNLDRENSLQIMGLLTGLHRQGNTIVLITHDERVASLAQRRLRLENGKLYSVTELS